MDKYETANALSVERFEHERARRRIAELEAALRTIASTFDETWLNGSIERQAGDLARAALQPKPTKE